MLIQLESAEQHNVIVDGQPQQYTCTHARLCKVELEKDRGDTRGYIMSWIEKGYLEGGEFVIAQNVAGLNPIVSGDAYDALMASQDTVSINSVWDMLGGYLLQLGLIQGTLVNDDGSAI
jgi:hypothetical protein